jgi:hypothetical protein
MAQSQQYSRTDAKSTTGNITASGQAITMAVTSPDQMIWTFNVTGTYTGISWIPEFSLDGGTTWLTGSMQPFDGGPKVTVTTGWATGQGTTWPNVTCPVPGGATNVRLRCSAFGTGTAVVRIWIGPGVLPLVTPPQSRVQSFSTTSNSTPLGNTLAPSRYYCTNFSTGYNGAISDNYIAFTVGGYTQNIISNSQSSTTESGFKIEHIEAYQVPLGPANNMAVSPAWPSSGWANATGFYSL